MYSISAVKEDSPLEKINKHYRRVQEYGQELQQKLESFNITNLFQEEKQIVEDVLFKSARLLCESNMLVNVVRCVFDPDVVYKPKPKTKEQANFICAKCAKTFTTKLKLSLHNCANKPKCIKCHKVFNSMHNFRIHNCIIYRCPKCYLEFWKKQECIEHKENCKGKLICKGCRVMFPSVTKKLSHQRCCKFMPQNKTKQNQKKQNKKR